MKNKKRELQAVLLDTKEKTVKIVHFENELDEIYRILGCTTIDIVERYVGGMEVDIICDDEGLYQENHVISAINREKEVMFVQNLLICGPTDDYGRLTGLTDEQCRKVMGCCRIALTQSGEVLLVLQCEYWA